MVVHNVLMIGLPGAGKTVLARAVPGILPRMIIDKALDVTCIYSVADQLPPDVPLIYNRPVRFLRRPAQAMHLLAVHRHQVPEAHLWTAARPH